MISDLDTLFELSREGENVGGEIAARATPDGHTTLMALNTQLTVNPSLYKMNFSVEKVQEIFAVREVLEELARRHQARTTPGV